MMIKFLDIFILTTFIVIIVNLLDSHVNSFSPAINGAIKFKEVSHEKAKMPVCNSEYCDSIVNKCLMTDRCKCNFNRETNCVKDCVDCLEEKFGQCCRCIDGLCSTDSHHDLSHIGNTTKNDDQMFDALTEEDDIHGRWSVEIIPQAQLLYHNRHLKSIGHLLQNYDDTGFNHCKVAFINRPLGLTKCKRTCTTMGANHFRWFHTKDCCQCIGRYCVGSGSKVARCRIDNSDLF